jgi:hypothetical protein
VPRARRRTAYADFQSLWRRLGIIVMLVGALFNAILIIQSLNLYHTVAVTIPLDRAVALGHARDLVGLERSLHLAIEPAVQRALAAGFSTPWGTLPGALLRSWAVWLYINAVPSWLFAALIWSYLFRREHFAWLRDLTIISAFLAVICYRVYPLAPPRFALTGAPYHMQDWTYGATSVDSHVMGALGFDPYAAFPSVHLLWALIPTLCLLVGKRPFWAWLVAPLFSAAMVVTIIGTGNHYLVDGLGAVLILAASALITFWLRRGVRRLKHAVFGRAMRLRQHELTIPPIPAFALVCAGTLAVVGVQLRPLLALDIVVMIAAASYGCRPLLRATACRLPRRATTAHCDCLAGVLFIAGATAATHAPGLDTVLGACLWFLACLSVIAGYRYAATAAA